MNWIFETYSNIYNAAMMQHDIRPVYAAHAKNSDESKTGAFARLFGRN
jgi:hypothetical protein